MRRSKLRRVRRYLRLSILVLAACGGDTSDVRRAPARAAQPEPRSPFLDSIRARRNAELRRRPDTLGMRADSARVLGAPTAQLLVIVTSDFQCHECRDFALNVLPELRREFIDSGRVRFAFINDPQERFFNARFAAQAALCAGTVGRFWQMHDQLFVNQASWERLDDPRDFFQSLAVAAGVPANAYHDCMSRNRMLRQLSSDIERSRETGVADVPTVHVGDRMLAKNELTVNGIRRAVLKALGER